MRMVFGGEDRRINGARHARATPCRRITKARFERVRAVWLSKMRWTTPACEKNFERVKSRRRTDFGRAFVRYRDLPRAKQSAEKAFHARENLISSGFTASPANA
jgi:hypothetical protein